MNLKIPRIPPPVVDQIPPARVDVPRFEPPVVNGLRGPVIDFPSIDIPSYEPPTFVPDPVIIIPNMGGGGGDEVEEDEETTEEREIPDFILPDPTVGRPVIDVPIIGTVPFPTMSEVSLAGTTAVAATAAALIGKSMVESLVKKFKPLVKKIMLKLKERGKNRFTDYELQLYFELEGKVPEQKQAAKLLKKEFADSKRTQLEAHLQRQHQSKPRRKVSQGGNKSHAE